MSRRPHEGPAEKTSLSSPTRAVSTDLGQLDELRRLLSGFSHRCRNSLNGMKMSLYLFRREARENLPPSWDELERTYQRIESSLDNLQTLYRPMALTMVRSPLGQLIRERAPRWRTCLQKRGRALQLDPPDQEAVGDFDPIQLGIGLDALASWRAESAETKTRTRVGWRTHDGSFEICWEEVLAVAASFSPIPDGNTGLIPGQHPSPRAHSLALPLLARILAAHGGRLEAPDESALCLMIRWPQFQSDS
jgi:hypothetical protein